MAQRVVLVRLQFSLPVGGDAQVIATVSARDVGFLRELGVETVIDYQSARFEDVSRDLDVVLDTVGGETQTRSWKVLRRGGTLVSIVAEPPLEQSRAAVLAASFFIVEASRPQLIEIGKLIDAGHVRPIVEAVFPLAKAREAFDRGLRGHCRGKIVLQVVANETRD